MGADAAQHEPVGAPPVEVVPVVAHGTPGAKVGGVMDGAVGLGVGIVGMGLRPPAPSSVEPMGMPMRPTGAVIVSGEADVVGAMIGAHVPDAVPAMPPPSNSMLGPVAVLGEVPERFPAGEVMARQVAGSLGAGPTGEIPDVVGLSPRDPTSVEPSGIPTGGTAAAGPMPSGEVMPSGDGALAPSCADEEPQPRISAAIAVISMRVMGVSST